MGISINSSSVTVTTVTVSFEDIYQYAVSNNKTAYVQKLGTSYIITVDVILDNGGNIIDNNKFITIEGDLFQIHKGSSLQLGTKRSNGSTIDGCTLNMPNVKLGYGFGCTTTTDSGDLFLYGSILNVFGFWGFFEGTNHVEIIDCFVDGFGRISGINSVLQNVIFKRSHGRYGNISAKGEIQTMRNLSVYASEPYGDFVCGIYHNPRLAGDQYMYYGEYGGYNTLGYIENYSTHNILEMRGSKILGNYNLYRDGNSKNVDFYHSFRYQGTIYSQAGDKLIGVTLTVKDKNGDVTHTVTSDQNGEIDIWINYYRDIAVTGITEIMTPHTFEFTKDTTTMTTQLYVNDNFEGIPIYLTATQNSNNTTVDYALIQDMITTAKDASCACSTADSDILSNKLSQIMIGMSDNIAETTQVIESHNDISVIC